MTSTNYLYYSRRLWQEEEAMRRATCREARCSHAALAAAYRLKCADEDRTVSRPDRSTPATRRIESQPGGDRVAAALSISILGLAVAG